MLTRADFVAFYPQFSAFSPEGVLEAFLLQANARFTDFLEDEQEAQRLYLAHKLTLYARTALPAGAVPSMALLASTGETQQTIAEKRVGEVSVKYATTGGSGEASRASSSFADLPETTYGLQLLSLIRLHARGRYVP